MLRWCYMIYGQPQDKGIEIESKEVRYEQIVVSDNVYKLY